MIMGIQLSSEFHVIEEKRRQFYTFSPLKFDFNTLTANIHSLVMKIISEKISDRVIPFENIFFEIKQVIDDSFSMLDRLYDDPCSPFQIDTSKFNSHHRNDIARIKNTINECWQRIKKNKYR